MLLDHITLHNLLQAALKTNQSALQVWTLHAPLDILLGPIQTTRRAMSPDSSLNHAQLQRIAELAKLNISDSELAAVGTKLNSVLALNQRLTEVDTKGVLPLSHPLELTQSMRADVVSQSDQRALFQKIAPLTKAGLYLVPQVIESE